MSRAMMASNLLKQAAQLESLAKLNRDYVERAMRNTEYPLPHDLKIDMIQMALKQQRFANKCRENADMMDVG